MFSLDRPPSEDSWTHLSEGHSQTLGWLRRMVDCRYSCDILVPFVRRTPTVETLTAPEPEVNRTRVEPQSRRSRGGDDQRQITGETLIQKMTTVPSFYVRV